MGSSLFAAYPAYLRMAEAGLDVRWWETAELLHYAAIPDGATIVMISQSGATAEILALRERLRQGQRLVAVTNEPASPLARLAHQVVLLGCPSQSLAATATFTATLFVMEVLAHASMGASRVPETWVAEVASAAEAMTAYLAELEESALPIPSDRAHLVFLARGPSLASAWQGALAFKEVAARGGEALSAAQFRHGPLEMAGPDLHAVVFVPHGRTAPLLLRLAREIEDFGGRVFLIADRRVAPSGRGHPAVSEVFAPFLNILPIQLAAVRMAEPVLAPGPCCALSRP